MKLLLRYLKNYWPLVALALVLAAINQVFSLLDPLIFRHVIDEYATKFQEYTTGQFFRGVSLLLAAAVGVAFVSRVAKNFQDYYINVITQRLGASIYSDGIRHSLELPYSVFEDQRSGETLGKLQKVRTDVEKLISASINVLFTSLVGIVFVMVYALSVHWIIAPAYFLTVPLLGVLSSVLSRKIKTIQKVIVAETTALAGATTESLRNIELVKSLGLAQQEIARLNATTGKILQLELKKVRYIRSLSFIQGTTVNLLRTSIMFLMLYLILHAGDHDRAVLLAVHLLVLHLRTAAGAGQHHQRLPGGGGLAQELPGHPQDADRAAAAQPDPAARASSSLVRPRRLHAPVGLVARRHRHFLRGRPRRHHRVRRSVRRRQDDAREAAGGAVSAAVGRHPVQRPSGGDDRSGSAARAHRLRHAGRAALLRHDSREPAVREPGGDRRGVPRRAAQGGLRQPARARRPRPRHGDRRGRRQGVGRREAAALDRARSCGGRTCSSSTRPPRRSTRSPKRRSAKRSATWPPARTSSRS